MKKLILYVLGLILINGFSLNAQVVINEVASPGTIELKNIGDSTVNVTNYWLCDFPSYQRIGNLNLQCGNLMMAPGDILVVDDFNVVSAADGEMGLYSNNSFGSSTGLESYVEWGSADHQRSSLAVEAGVWTAGDFVPAFGEGASLEFDGAGIMASDWSAQDNPSICEENGGPAGCNVNGGSLTGGPFEFCVGDGEADMLEPGSISLEGNSGFNTQWVVTDDQGTILGLPPMPSAVDFDGAGPGTCLVWHLSFDGELQGLEMGQNANDLEGCFDLSNPVEVVRNQPEGGELTGGPFEFCVGDGEADMLEPGSITLAGNTGSNSQWVVTDDQGTILGLPPMPSVVNFDGAGPGTCLVWHLSYEGEITGLEMGQNASDLEGCFDLSNPVEVIRNQPEGGELVGGPFAFCVGDGQADMLEPGSISLSGNTGSNSKWVVTDDQGTILGLPPMPSVVNFDGAGPGVCLVWHLSYDGEITGLEMGQSANDLQGCFDLSNPVEVIRSEEAPEGGELVGGPFEFCVGDGEADMLEPGSITLSGNTGANSQWVVTDDQGTILGLPPMPSVVNFDGAGPGTCLVWHLSYDGEITGLEMGQSANDLQGCFDLSNPVEVIRTDEATDGGELVGGPFE
ncbi:MAG: hypothetical protein AAGD05_01745, partial [Bacteroidota bacterium]